MKNTTTVFEDKITQLAGIHAGLKKKYAFWSTIRVVVFLVFTIAIIYFANRRDLDIVIILGLIFPVVFGIIIQYHNKIAFRKTHTENLKQINIDEILRHNGKLKSFESGAIYLDPAHAYNVDLDIFGSHSIFQLINRTTTFGARDKLASWLNYAADKNTILERQKATGELQPKLEWRQDFQAHGMHFQQEENKITPLLKWLAQDKLASGKAKYKILIILMPILALVSIGLMTVGYSYLFLVAVIVINAIILKDVFQIAKETTDYTADGSIALQAYGFLIKKVEEESFAAPLLVRLKDNFDHDHFRASAEIKKLQKILFSLESRANIFYWILNGLFLLDVFWLLKGASWRERNKQYAENWFETIHQFEVLNSIAGFGYLNPDFCIPQISNEDYELEGEELGHPMITASGRICNDFTMSGKGKLILITGSNMSGKSTFLRTIATNVVLALLGAPVCATRFITSVNQVFTGMRTQDNLEESVSSFYAELKRLRQLLDMIGSAQPVLFMLDEILKGTNSHDRHNGAASLIKQLSELNCFGFVSTHDLELGSLANSLPNLDNFSFNSQIIDDEIIFDYKLHHGLCKSFNASKLMEKMGIKISED